jgi:signal transduction histidine kinase
MPSPRQSILVVDDTPANLKLLEGMLRECGYRVRPVTNGLGALRAAASEPPDLILLDISMPDMDGYEVCHRLKADPATAEIPVLFISALTAAEDKVRAFEAGGLDYVSKPFQLTEVAARVRTHLQLRAQQRQLQESLQRQRELERMRDQLTHMIAHDMRSPLLALKLTIDLLRSGPSSDDPMLLDGARIEVGLLVEMVSQMLDVSRMESGALTLNIENVDLTDLAAGVLTSLKPLARERSVAIEAPESVTVPVDRELVRRVIANLLGNAFKFASPRGRVALRIESNGDRIRVAVTDDGAGIAPEHHARIFEKFGQVEASRQKYGTGLGLTFAKMAVEAHGGEIGVISAVGQGSTFWFTLPLTRATDPASVAGLAPAAGQS